ncbi:PREDICTED: LOW QUALITY PROTEIN: putative serine/threonine-protein kinase-like protein CCR3 [Tarenaya hassleriana]|uniref:LOW QUALITY PROTEIN: putative serine/threonine-protein kinase-like protein CCR3 n=1 Tax=Tarenaya hassleriana TaxID=28532 RepID=UPI00053C9490|nr:PREDICTED: LOW QUALITY PROTEIN: putative serine/threonine-protein kinase-like protein CCR3 [Tarenaya hassleriana]
MTMNFLFSTVTAAVSIAVAVVIIFSPSPAAALGSGSTFAVVYGSDTVCALVAGEPTQRIICYDTRRRDNVTLDPGVSFSSIAAGESSLCGIRSGGYSLLCWDNIVRYGFTRKRIYQSNAVLLDTLAVGDRQVCATVNGTGSVKCWREQSSRGGESLPENEGFRSVSSGVGFSCGVSIRNSRIRCWGSDPISGRIQNGFGNMSMLSFSAGESHACGLNSTGHLICIGNNDSGQLNFTSNRAFEYSGLALGSDFTCATRRPNDSVVCWGGGSQRFNNVTEQVSFVSVSSGSGLVCGLVTANLSIMCWNPSNFSRFFLPFPEILPGPCVESSSCVCGVYPQSDRLCFGSSSICSPCPIPSPAVPLPPLPSAPSPVSHRSKALTNGLLAFAIVGSIGTFIGICTVVYCLWTGICFGKKKVHNSVQPTITRGGSQGRSRSNSSPPSRSLTIRRQGSRMLSMRRQRSGTSSKHADKAEEFTFSELAAATGNFSLENKIGSGSFGVVYKGKLSDGREVAIKRGEISAKAKKFQEKESAFDSEIAFLSRLHHKHLVRLVGYCEEREERLLVYDYMKNGALYDHLHHKENVEKHSSLINSWKIRIRIALDAARGIEYLHNYAVPPIIHRDIKSSNILLDADWTARVSDFGLSMMGPDSGKENRPMKAAGTVGYIDPEYYSLNVLTDKSDVYGLGVVLLELITGKRAIFKNGNGEEGNSPIHLVDFAVPAIAKDELGRVLDPRITTPELGEAEAVELVAYTAMHCVNTEGRNRPTMTDIVANLERALDLCGDSHGSISSGIVSIVSE